MKRIGVIGGGQLAWMMGSAAKKLGVELVVQTPSPNDPAVAIAKQQYLIEQQGQTLLNRDYSEVLLTEYPGQTLSSEPFQPALSRNSNSQSLLRRDGKSDFFVQARVDDAVATAELAKKSDVITFENEFVDVEALSTLAERGVCFRPSLEAIAPLLDKYHQRCYLRDIGLPVPKFAQFDVTAGLQDVALKDFDFPFVLKARRHGYDGQGTYIVQNKDQLQTILAQLEKSRFKITSAEFLIEEFIPFTRELAVIAARSVDGEVVTYPVVETQQEHQVCRRALAPAAISPQVITTTQKIAAVLLNSLDVVGVFGIELFLTADDTVVVNEVAPRTHNSGHFSLDACQTSQFEQHLRAVCGLPLGNPTLICTQAVMVNLLGYENSQSDYQQKRQQIEKIQNAHLHWYGKTESRPGRKLGHVTILLENHSREDALVIARSVESIWYPK